MLKFDNILEFGPGNYSTDYFIKHCKNVISIEMQNQEWYDIIYNRFQDVAGFSIYLSLGPFEYHNLDIFKEGSKFKPDLCFIDGHGDGRWECVNFMMDLGCEYIIAHDTQAETYNLVILSSSNYKFQLVYRAL